MPKPDHTGHHSCDECGSTYRREASTMAALCPECAHWIYGLANCTHDMRDGVCTRCGWNGSVSSFVRKLKSDHAQSR